MEIERKYIITEELYNKLLKIFGTEQKTSLDTYYCDNNNSWIRVRLEEGFLYVTRKEKTYSADGTEVNNEFEISLNPTEENESNLIGMLTSLGFKPIHQKKKEKHDFYVEPITASFEKVESDGKVIYAVEIETIQDDELQAKEDLDLMLNRIVSAIGQNLETCHKGWDELLGWKM